MDVIENGSDQLPPSPEDRQAFQFDGTRETDTTLDDFPPPPEDVSVNQSENSTQEAADESSMDETEEDDDDVILTEYPKAKFGISTKNKPLLLVTVKEGVAYSFMLQVDRKNYQYWTCVACRVKRRRLKENQVTPLPKVSSLKFLKNRNAISHEDIEKLEHCCEAESVSPEWLESEQIIRIIGHEVRETRAPPAEAILQYDGMLTEAVPTIMNEVALLVKRKSLKRRFRRNRVKKGPRNVDPHQIPLDLQKSLLPDGGNVIQHFAEEGPPLIVMADDHNLRILAGSKDVVMDGTFSRAPENSRQLYTLHGLYMDGTERQKSFVSAVLVLSSATEETYTNELRRLRQKMEALGPIQIQRFHLDCEEAVINAVKTVFPESQVTLCYFHFIKNLYDKLNKSRAHDLKRHAEFKKFIQVIQGTVFLPIDVYREYFPKILLAAPDVGTTLRRKLHVFLNYLSQFVFRRDDFLNQFDNAGPRTTNLAEGYHHGLHELFPETHPHFGKLIQKMKEILRSAALAFRNCADGTNLDRRTQGIIESDNRINAAKLEFAARYRQNLIDLAEVMHYCRHQALNASPSRYDASDPDAVYPNFAAMQTYAEEQTTTNPPRVQTRRQRAIPSLPVSQDRASRPTRGTRSSRNRVPRTLAAPDLTNSPMVGERGGAESLPTPSTEMFGMGSGATIGQRINSMPMGMTYGAQNTPMAYGHGWMGGMQGLGAPMNSMAFGNGWMGGMQGLGAPMNSMAYGHGWMGGMQGLGAPMNSMAFGHGWMGGMQGLGAPMNSMPTAFGTWPGTSMDIMPNGMGNGSTQSTANYTQNEQNFYSNQNV